MTTYIKTKKKEIKRNNNDLLKLQKKVNNLNEYIDIGAFFTNLEIHSCPHCNHEVEETRILQEKETKVCKLCNHQVTERLSDPKFYVLKLDEYNGQIAGTKEQVKLYERDISLIKKDLAALRKKQQLLLKHIDKQKKQLLSLKEEYAVLNKSIKELSQKYSYKDVIKLEKDLAVLEYRKDQLSKNNSLTDGYILKEHQKIRLLDKSIDKLKAKRLDDSQFIIRQLEDFMLNELTHMGLRNIERVQIKSNFKIDLHINDTVKSLDSGTEGEKLRGKLALFLGIIQLSIANSSSGGKHPRLLIIDSPLKEEADPQFVAGLKLLIEEISTNHNDKLQIIIATAERGLEDVNINGKKYIIPEEEFVF